MQIWPCSARFDAPGRWSVLIITMVLGPAPAELNGVRDPDQGSESPDPSGPVVPFTSGMLNLSGRYDHIIIIIYYYYYYSLMSGPRERESRRACPPRRGMIRRYGACSVPLRKNSRRTGTR